jgi:hypothetical protein
MKTTGKQRYAEIQAASDGTIVPPFALRLGSCNGATQKNTALDLLSQDSGALCFLYSHPRWLAKAVGLLPAAIQHEVKSSAIGAAEVMPVHPVLSLGQAA